MVACRSPKPLLGVRIPQPLPEERSSNMHQHFIKGRKLLLIYKDGHQELGKYRVSDKGVLYFSDRDPVPLSKLRSAGYYKPTP